MLTVSIPNVTISSFSASPATVSSGGSSTLSWSVSYSGLCTITSGTQSLDLSKATFSSSTGLTTVSTGPLTQSTAYELRCAPLTGATGGYATKLVTVSVAAPTVGSVTGASSTATPFAPNCTDRVGKFVVSFNESSRTPACYGGKDYAYLKYGPQPVYPGAFLAITKLNTDSVLFAADHLDGYGSSDLMNGYECNGTETVTNASPGTYSWSVRSRNNPSTIYETGTVVVPSCTTSSLSQNQTANVALAFGETTLVASELTGGREVMCTDLKNSLSVGSTDASTNNEVSRMQYFLASKNYLDSITGYFGVMTAAGLVKFQTDNQLIPTGIVGMYTRAKIKELSCQ